MSQAPANSNIIEQQGPNQIVRIRSDSETNLDDLFKAVMHPKDSQVQLGVPMRMRKLPSSFFQQPDRGSKSASHSRESSTDATAYSPVAAPSSPTPPPPPGHPSGLPINHPRAHSSPATLQQTYNSNTSQHQHLRQHSYDITDEIPLPPGWAMAKTATGQRYFLNHFTKTTTWEDPRKKLVAAAAQAAAAAANNSNNNSSSTSGAGSTSSSPSPGASLSPPPQPSPAPSSNNNNNNTNNNNNNNNNNSSNSNNPSTTTPSANTALSGVSLGPLPDGWEQATTPSGETYFINHIECTTSWFDPRIPVHLQRPPLVQGQGNTAQLILCSQQGNNQSPQAGVLGSTNGVISQQASLQQRQQKLRLQRLQMERERLKVRQQEILRQAACLGNPMLNEMVLRRSLGEEMMPTSPPPNDQSVTGVDPFLSGSSDYHSRQESADSGLGLGPNYSLPHTPEDFLSNMDDSVDTIGDDSVHTVGDLGLESLQTSSLDLGAGENMDSDDLVPSLQEELTGDILPDIEALLSSNKDNVLTWL